jgi:hypothetical protein
MVSKNSCDRLAKLRLIVPLMFCVVAWSTVSEASGIAFSDGFEGPSIDPFWTVVQQFGTVSLTTAQAHTGTQSVAFSSASGGQRELHLEHTFVSSLIGDVSLYFFDAAPGQETLYEQLVLRDSTTSSYFAIGTQDYDANCYVALASTPGGDFGPNANCGAFPQTNTTNVLRTSGWHLLDINIQAGGVSFGIDGNQVFAQAGAFTFDMVDFYANGPAFRPNTTAYFDDFNINASTQADAVPEPATMLLLGSGVIAGGLKRRFRPSGKPAADTARR